MLLGDKDSLKTYLQPSCTILFISLHHSITEDTYSYTPMRKITYTACTLFLAACSFNEAHHDHNHAHHHDGEEIEAYEDDDEDKDEHHHHNGNVIEFHDEMAELVDFCLDTCRTGVMLQTIKTVAQIKPAMQDEHIIVANASGIITLGPHVLTGSIIKAGQVVATTNSSTIEGSLRMQLRQAQAELERAEAELKRKEQLANDHIASQSELAEAQSAYTKAKAAVDDLRHVSSSGQATVRATETEYVRHLYVQNGQMVNTGDPIASVSHNMSLFLEANIQPRYYKQLQNIAGANINIDGQWHDISEYGGRFVSCGRSTSTDSPLLPVTFEIQGSVDIVAGTFVEMYIKTATTKNTLSIPSSSLIEEMGNYYVFVKVADEHYEKREVHIGQTDGKLTEIKDGLKGNEVVVSRGAIIVKLASVSGNLDAHSGHVH